MASKVAQFRTLVNTTIETSGELTEELAANIINVAFETFGLSNSDSKYYLKKEFNFEYKTARAPRTPSTSSATVNTSATKTLSKPGQLRAKFAEMTAAETEIVPEELVTWAVTEVGMSNADARYYVKLSFGDNFPGWVTKDGVRANEQKTPKISREKKEKTPTSSLNNLIDVQAWLTELGIECTGFDGITLQSAVGNISMAFGDFFVTRNPELVTEGRPAVEMMSPKHLRRYVLNDNSKIGKLTWA